VSFVPWVQTVARLAALTAALVLGADDSDARLAEGASFAPGGASVFDLVAATETETTRSAPMMAQTVPQTYPGGSLSGLFSRGGLIGGFAAGFLGCGVLGLLFGRGLFGELGGVASYAGLIVQLALLALLCRLIWTRWRRDDAAGIEALSPRQLADAYLRSRDDWHAGPDPSAGLDDGIADADPDGRPSEAAQGGRARD
jgi:predicted lipid-binding transport protein (Tim44 family)